MPGTLFEELGFNYIGPVDGHDVLGHYHHAEEHARPERPAVPAYHDQKVGGYEPAEKDPIPSTPCLNLIPPAVVCRKVAAVCRAIQNLWRLVVRETAAKGQQADGDYSGDA